MEKILITGGAGFIGSHLAEYHLEKGDEVFAIDNLDTGRESNFDDFKHNPNFKFHKSDILTTSDLDEAVAWSTRVYHMAAVVGVYRVLQHPVQVLAVNVAACERLLRAANKVKNPPRVIIASSSEVYGFSGASLLEETAKLTIESAADGRACYAISKIADEAFGLAYAKKYHVPTTLVRLFNTTGRRQTGRYGMVVPRFVRQAINNEPITVYGDGTQTRSFCNVKDTVVALDKLAGNRDAVSEIINVGNDEEITINNLAKLVKKLAKSQSEILHIPYEEAYGEPFDDIKRRRPDLKKLYRYIDFTHQWTLEKTIKDLISHSR